MRWMPASARVVLWREQGLREQQQRADGEELQQRIA
jgi:hypothetical protein